MRNKISDQERATTKITAKRVVLWAFGGLLALIVLASVGLMLTFTPAKLKIPAVEVGELPPASPPVGMSVSILPTGTYQTRAALAFRGGSWSDIRQFAMTALLVRHPKGNLLIDTGAGKNVDTHVKIMPAMMRATTDYTKAIPAVIQLAAGGISLRDLAAVIPTHAHWDHISGVDDLPGVPVLVTAENGIVGWVAGRERCYQLGQLRATEASNKLDCANFSRPSLSNRKRPPRGCAL